MKIVHLPCYDINPYQKLMIEAQAALGHTALDGGGGGYFLGTALRSWKADVLHLHWLHPYLLRRSSISSIIRSIRFILEILILKATGTTIAWTIHNLANHEGCHHGIEHFFTKIFASLADTKIAHTNTAAQDAAAHFNIPIKDITVIPHGNFCDLYTNNISTESAKKQLNISPKEHAFLFFGRINPYKGVDDLISSFLKCKGEHLRLFIAGSPSDQNIASLVTQLASSDPRITLRIERIPDEDIQLYFNAADAIVFPYKNILTSGAVILAMSFGRSIIAPDLPGIRDTLPDKGSIWFEPNNRESLSQALQESSESNSTKSGNINLEFAKKWNWKTIGELTLNSYYQNYSK